VDKGRGGSSPPAGVCLPGTPWSGRILFVTSADRLLRAGFRDTRSTSYPWREPWKSLVLQHAHGQGIVHRDLKPANILLAGEPDAPLGRCLPKLVDFGLAKKLDEGDRGLTRSGAVLGTPSYMAPEQAEGRTSEVGPPVDVYALGAILYVLLTGQPPFRGSTVSEPLRSVIADEPGRPRKLRPGVPPISRPSA
jgi:serine/threonine protein kinase